MDVKKYVGLAILVAVLATTEGAVFNQAAQAEACVTETTLQHKIVYENVFAAFTQRVGNVFRAVIEGDRSKRCY